MTVEWVASEAHGVGSRLGSSSSGLFLNFQKLCCSLVKSCYSILFYAFSFGSHDELRPKQIGFSRLWGWMVSHQISAGSAPVPCTRFPFNGGILRGSVVTISRPPL